MIHVFDKRYELPSWHHLTRLVLPNRYGQSREELTVQVCKADAFLVMTDIDVMRKGKNSPPTSLKSCQEIFVHFLFDHGKCWKVQS